MGPGAAAVSEGRLGKATETRTPRRARKKPSATVGSLPVEWVQLDH